jgi:hypothetical protein
VTSSLEALALSMLSLSERLAGTEQALSEVTLLLLLTSFALTDPPELCA